MPHFDIILLQFFVIIVLVKKTLDTNNNLNILHHPIFHRHLIVCVFLRVGATFCRYFFFVDKVEARRKKNEQATKSQQNVNIYYFTYHIFLGTLPELNGRIHLVVKKKTRNCI